MDGWGQERARERRLRDAAEEIMSLNLDDLDMEELERRMEILSGLEEASGVAPSAHECGRFRCGSFFQQ